MFGRVEPYTKNETKSLQRELRKGRSKRSTRKREVTEKKVVLSLRSEFHEE